MRRFVRTNRKGAGEASELDRPYERAFVRPSSIKRSSISRRSDNLSRPSSKKSTLKRSQSGSTTSRPSLLNLPPEIRLAIWRYILPPNNNTNITHSSKPRQFKFYTDNDSSDTDRKRSVQRGFTKLLQVDGFALAILRTNRQVYYEGLSVLYSENAFHFVGSNFLPVLDFMRRLSGEARGCVKTVRVTMLPEGQSVRGDQLELFCRVVHDWLPGLNVLDSGSWVWI
ncbi:hypothetical protein EJ08DRAFT_635180 [Tothia fuscella]|uniref:DUF7730 domain-containing protein n=1 Tax=Tothia fuscella TaxID=1048955 RepID=A0A9P4TY35_9PEZI|nr:hypothetical protein EJ08DRAFT_635180 [Tothia fuscella]